MRYVLIICAAICLIGCGPSREQKQHAADAIAGVQALAAESGTATAAVIANAIEPRILCAADVPRDELPAPTMTADQIRIEPQRYGDTAPAEPTGGGMLKWIVAAAGVALAAVTSSRVRGVVSTLLRFLPGPWGGIANMAWDIFATAAQKKDDGAQAVAKAAATKASEMLQKLIANEVDPALRLKLEPIYTVLCEHQRI